jgi:hypothetical protein
MPTLLDQPPAAETPEAIDPVEDAGVWRSRLAAARTRRDSLIWLWQQNVDARRGTQSETAHTTEQVVINQDWPLTKAKIAQLYSQTPEIRLTPRQPQYQPVTHLFANEINQAITDASVGTTIEEVLADVINASGIGAVLCACETRTEPRQVPAIDPQTLTPDQQMQVQAGMIQLPMKTVDHVVDVRHMVTRISPADLLIPSDFTGSNYDHARWLAHDDRMTWAQAQRAFKLTPDQKDDVLGSDDRSSVQRSLSTDTTKFRDTDVVNYTQVFYWRHYYHADETSFKALQRLVFVDGIDDPVINEPYTGQTRTPTGIAGVTENPIRVLTLTYVSDDSLPPSDSSVGRFQVDELTASRNAMVAQRKGSVPIRWFDTNRVSSGTRSLLEKGTYQGFIPMNGPADRAIGEVARAVYPAEKFEFDRIIKNDLGEMWQIGSNQTGTFASGERSAKEASIIQANFQRRVGQEQDKVTRLFVGIAKVLAGHLAIYGNFALPDDIGQNRALLANSFIYTVRADGTVRLDAEQRIEQLLKALNVTAQSGYVNPKPIITEIWELSGVDPATVVIDPQPKAPEPVKVSISKAEDLMNPIFLALLMRTHQAPDPGDLSGALNMLRKLAEAAVTPGPPQPGIAVPEPTGQPPGDLPHPNWEAAPRIDRRSEDGGA